MLMPARCSRGSIIMRWYILKALERCRKWLDRLELVEIFDMKFMREYHDRRKDSEDCYGAVVVCIKRRCLMSSNEVLQDTRSSIKHTHLQHRWARWNYEFPETLAAYVAKVKNPLGSDDLTLAAMIGRSFGVQGWSAAVERAYQSWANIADSEEECVQNRHYEWGSFWAQIKNLQPNDTFKA